MKNQHMIHDADTPGWRSASRARVRGHHRHPAGVRAEQESGECLHEVEIRQQRALRRQGESSPAYVPSPLCVTANAMNACFQLDGRDARDAD